MRELLVNTSNPAELDQVLRPFGGLVRQHPDGAYATVEPEVYAIQSRSGELALLRFVITHHGYGTVVGEREI